MDEVTPGFGGLVQPTVQPNIPELSAADSPEVEYKKWLAMHPKGQPVDFSTWQAGMQQRQDEMNNKVRAEVSAEHAPTLAARLGSQTPDVDSSLPAALYSHTVDSVLQKPSEGWSQILGGAGSLVDKVGGTDNTVEHVGQQVGQGVPRMFATMIGGPTTMLGDTAAKSYGETGDAAEALKSTALTAGTLGLAHVGGNVAEDMLAKHLLKTFTETGAPAALESMSTGVAPKIARSAGAIIGGGLGQEAGHQVDSLTSEGKLADPFTVQNIASQVMSGALMAAPDMATTWTKSDINIRAQDRLAEWANKRASDVLKERGLQPDLAYQPTDTLIKNAIATDPSPDWRKNLIKDGVDTLANTSDPYQRTSVLGRLTDAVIRSRNLDSLGDTADRQSKLTYIQPPTDIAELTAKAQQLNALKTDAMSKLDDMIAHGDETTVSSAAYRQLEQQGHLKDFVTLDWLKTRFGENVERSLSNSDSHGWLVLTQQLANEMKAVGEVAKAARGETLVKSDSGEPSPSILDDRLRMSNFFDAVSKVGDTKLREGLIERFLHHENTDNMQDTGVANKFADEITQVINSVVQGKSPEELAALDWNKTVGSTQKRIVNVDPISGVETRDQKIVPVGIQDYLNTDSEGHYLRKVYGRSSRNQNEILASTFGDVQKEPTGETDSKQELATSIKTSQRTDPKTGVLENVPSTEGLTPKQGWYDSADAVRKHIEGTEPDVLWRIIAPELMNARGSVDPRVAKRLQPIVKDLVQAIFELGPKGVDANRTLSPAGERVLKALVPDYNPATNERKPVDMLSQVLRYTLGTSRSDSDVRQGIIRRVAEKAGVTGPQGMGELNTRIQPTTVNTGNAMFDAQRLFSRFFGRLGYEPELADHFTKLGMRTLSNFDTNSLELGLIDSKSAYRALTASFDQLATAGGYWNPTISGTGRPMIGLALDHYADTSTKALVSWHALSVLTHELVHDIQHQAAMYDGLTPPTAYSKERIGAYNQLERMAEFYTPPQRMAFLRAVAEASIPKSLLYSKKLPDGQMSMHPTIEGNLRYGAGIKADGTQSNVPPYEFVNTFAQVIGLGMLTGGNGKMLLPREVFAWMPEEQQLFAKGVYRDLHDNLGALQEAVHNPMYRRMSGLSPIQQFGTGDSTFIANQLGGLVRTTQRMLVGIDPAKSAAQANQIVSMLEQGVVGNWKQPIARLEFTDEGPEGAKVQKALEDTQMLLFGDPSKPADIVPETSTPPKKPIDEKQLLLNLPEELGKPPRPAVNISRFWRRAVLFQQTLDRMTRRELPLAHDVMEATRDFGPAQNRLSLGLWSPFMTKDGKFDSTNPLIDMRTDDTVAGRRDNAMVNKIMEWQQRKGVEAIEQKPDGTFGLTPKAQKDLNLMDLPQRVIGSVSKMSEVGQLMGKNLVESRVNSAANRTAKLMMTIFPPELGDLGWRKAYADATNIVRGMTYDNQQATIQGMTDYPEPVRQAIENFLGGGIVESLKDLNNQVTSRTWWMTEQRPGKYLIESYKGGVRHVDGAETSGQAMLAKEDLTKKGFTNISVVSRADKQKSQAFDAPENILQHYMDLEQAHFEKYLTQNPNGLTPEQVENIRAYAPTPGSAVSEMLQKRGTNKFLIQRQGVPAAYGLDYTDNMRSYISRMASTVSRQAINQKVELILSDKSLDNQQQFKQYVRENVGQFMVPSSDLEVATKAFTTVYYMGANLSSMLVNATDAINTLPATLMTQAPNDTYGLGDSVRHTTQGLKDAAFFGAKVNKAEVDKLVQSATIKQRLGQKLDPQEYKAVVYRKAVENGILNEGLYQDVLSDHDADLRILTAKQFGTSGQQLPKDDTALLGDGLYRVSKALMVIPHMTSRFNNQVVFMAGVGQAHEAGMTPEQAGYHADKVRTLTLFAGGKSNAPGYIGAWGKENTMPAFRIVHTLQQYNMGFIGKWLDHVSESIDNDPGLTPAKRIQAQKAAATMTMTMLATAGAMGIPGLAAAMVLLQKKAGINAEAAVREGLAQLTGADKDNSGFRGLLTEVAMNGIPNQVFGVNVGQRLGMPDYLGLSSYDGYNILDAAGPTVSMVGNMFDGLGYLAQGDVQKAATKLLPNVLRRPVDLAMTKLKFGDSGFRDASDQLVYSPNSTDVLKYSLGFNPTALTERQRLRNLVTQSNQSFERKKAQHDNELGQALMEGNAQPAKQEALQQMKDGLLSPQQVPAMIRSLADRGLTKSQPQDPVASAPLGNAREAQAIARTFPKQDYQHQPELEKVKQRIGVEVRAGVPRNDYSQEYSRAMVVDSMVQRGMTPQEAERVAAMLGL